MIKKIIGLMKGKFQKIMNIYPVSLILITITSIFTAIFLENDIMDMESFFRVFIFLFFLNLGYLFTETYLKKIQWKILSFIGFFIVSFLLMLTIINEDVLAARLGVSYTIILGTLIVYRLYQNSGKKLASYFLGVASNFLKTTIIYWALSIGIIFVLEIFALLILDNESIELIMRVELLLAGLFYLPNILSDFVIDDLEISHLIHVIMHYIYEIFVLMAFGIIYLYLLKLLITWTLPSNEIFRLLSVLFILSLPAMIMNNHYQDKISKINSYLPFFFIPLIILEVYSLTIRIMDSGITSTRYLGIILIIFQMAYIIFALLKKDEYNFFSVIILTLVASLVPYVNMIYVSNMSQVNVIKSLMQSEMTDMNKSKIYSAYQYLEYSVEGNDYINKYLGEYQDKLDEIVGSHVDCYSCGRKYFYINASYNAKVSTAGYQNMESFFKDFYGSKNLLFTDYGVNYDLTDKLNEYIDVYQNGDLTTYFNENHEIVSDTWKIVLTNLHITYDDQITYCSLGGYFLEKSND